MSMPIWEKALHAVLNAALTRRDVIIDGELYMRRWFLKGRGTDSQWFLHNIRKPDKGRALHDHPWNFTTRILKGGYREQLRTPVRANRVGFKESSFVFYDRMPGDKMTVGANHTHRIDDVYGSTYTLVNAGPAVRTWGFWTDAFNWVDWRTYLKLPQNTPDEPEDEVK